jgi:glutathione synthase
MRQIAFQMDPMTELNFASDTSWQLMIEGYRRAKIYHFTPEDLFWDNGEVMANMKQVHISDDYNYVLDDAISTNLKDMNAIFIRQNPPYDMKYLTSTYLLEKISDQALMINNPKAIRDFPEKLSVLNYPQFTPPTLITYNPKEAIDFAKNYEQVIIKPLYSFAGNDVFSVKHNDINFTNIISNLIQIHKTPVIIQKFIPQVVTGDKRIIIVNGEPVGSFLRIPQSGDIRSNLACGGTAVISEITDLDLEICKALKPMLVKNGLFLAGIDVIGGYLTEINITSPTGIVKIQEFHNPKITSNIWDIIEAKI